ncbi:MAG: response regulator [Magnetococcales bacterium]|nr:response regulator [Magnetococcales bacterium]MBF0149893.1 response regulator [Magnetococcales bacterium]MBF0346547.1 response regulator [Magnetococcales bacterium]
MSRILIIDDEQENLDSLKRALQDENPEWEILTANNETEGKKLLESQLTIKDPVDVVLTDLVMEDEKSGMNVLQFAKQLDPFVMTILFTAKEKSLDRFAAFDFGAFDVVEKNIRGTTASREINIKTRAALKFRESMKNINFMRRYFDPKVFNVIERDPSILSVSERLVTIAFWDIRGFSQLCESLKAYPTLISAFLKDYFETGSKIIFKHHGIVDNFIGDGIMALFGVFNHKDDQGKEDAIHCVQAALDFKKEFDQVLEKWKKEWMLYIAQEIDIGLGCGIHTGEAIVGNVGTDFRDQFTALGPSVNFASRIADRSGKGQIVVSQPTKARIESDFSLIRIEVISDIKNIPGRFELFKIT